MICAWLEGIKFRLDYHEEESLRKEYTELKGIEPLIDKCRNDFMPMNENSYNDLAIQEDMTLSTETQSNTVINE